MVYARAPLSWLAALGLLGACGDVPTSASVVGFGGERPATLQVPEGVSTGQTAALVVILHDYGSSGEEVLETSTIGAAASSAGVFAIAPDGLIDSNGSQFWNGGACCDFDQTGVDDAAYIVSLLEEVAAEWPIDPEQIRVVGFGAGGFLAYDLGCRFGAAIGTIVSVGGAAPLDESGCEATVAPRTLHIHGDQDELVSYFETNEQPGALGSAALFAQRNGCQPLPVTIERLDLDVSVDGRETRVGEFPGCDGRAQLWTLEGSLHMPEPTPSFAPRVINTL